MDLRKSLETNGFTCIEDSDLVEVWYSRRSPKGEWLAVRIEDCFGGTTVQFEVHTLLAVNLVPTPASEEDLIALMGEMGVPR
jgi:hypothetical protein